MLGGRKLSCWLLLLTYALLFCGCAKTLIPFTEVLKRDLKLSDEEIRSLQYYVSGPILLERELKENDREVKGGKLIMRAGQQIHQVVVEKHTPGVAISSHICSLKMTFLEGTFLVFSTASDSSDGEPDCKYRWKGNRENKYMLFGSWDGGPRGYGDVVFEELEYRAHPPSGLAHLLIDKEALLELEKKRRVLPGVRLEQLTEK